MTHEIREHQSYESSNGSNFVLTMGQVLGSHLKTTEFPPTKWLYSKTRESTGSFDTTHGP